MISAVMIAAAFFQGAVYRVLMRVAPHIHHVAAAFLVSAGFSLLWLPFRMKPPRPHSPRACGPSACPAANRSR